MRHLVLSTFVSLTMAGQAPAEFVVKTAQPALVSDPVPQPTPIARSETDTGNQAEAKPTPDKPRFKMAYGFGKSVPLAFACRQIVPSAVRITYGPGADQAVLVDWKGGDTWNHVLRDAVQPLGLHLVMTTMAVEIRR
jgi:hypothetical protein